MAREFSIIVSINAAGARRGGREFKQGADQIVRSSRRMTAGMNRSRRSAVALITTIGRIRGVATLMFAGFLGVGGIAAVIRTMAQFETKMSAVNALLGERGSTQIMRVLTDRARELGATTAFTATQAAEGMKFLTLAGFDALEVFQAIGPALTLAQAGALGLGEAADIVSNVMAAFAIDAGKVIEVVDALAFVSARSNTNIRQLGQAMKFVAPVAGALGVSVTDTAVALGILGNAGLQASLAGTSLRRVMSGLLNPSKEATAVLAQMGLTSIELVDLLDKEDGLVLIIEKLAAAGLDAADAFTLFGQRGAPGVLALKAQRVELRALTQATREAEGAAKDMAETMIDNLGGDAKIAISALAEGILQMSEAGLNEFLRDSTQGFTGFIRGLTGMTAGLSAMSESMQAGVKNGEALKAQFDNIKKAAIVLAVVLSRGLIGSFITGALAVFRFAKLIFRSIAVLVAFRSGALALTVALQGLKAAFLTSPLGIALLVGSLLAYILTGEDAEEISRKQAEGLQKIVEAGDDAALTFDKVAEAQKKFKKVQIVDAIRAQREVMKSANAEMKAYTNASDALEEAQTAAGIASKAFSEGLAEGVGRGALAKLASASLGASNAVKALNSTIDEASFEELEATVEAAREKFFEFLKTASSMDEVLAGNQDFIDSVAEAAAKAAEEIRKFEKNFRDITGVTVDWNIALKKTVNGLLPMVAAQEKAKKALVDIRIALEKTDRQLIKMGQSRADLTRAEMEAEFQLKKSLRTENALEQARSKQLKTTEDLADKLFDLKNNTGGLAALTREYTRSVLEAAIAVAVGSMTIEEYTERVSLLRKELSLAQTELKKTCDETEELEECMSDSAKAMETLWDQALRNIQDSFADAFKGAFDSFEDFADNLLDAFKTLVANILAEAAILNIFGKGTGFFSDVFSGLSRGFGGGGGGVGSVIGSVVSGGTGTGGGAGVLSGGLSGVTSQLSSAWAGFTASVGAFFQGAGSFLGGASSLAGLQPGAAFVGPPTLAQQTAFGNVGGFTAGGVVAGAGIGALTGAVTDAILGGRGDPTRNAIFSAIGGAIGSIWSPIGAVIGGAIGSLLDNLFGGAKKLESAVIELRVAGDNFFGTQIEIVSKQRSFFRGKKLTTTTTDLNEALNDIEAVFKALGVALEEGAAALGADASGFLDDFSASLDLDIRNLSSSQITAAMTSFFERTMNAAITEWLNDVEGLSDDARTILMSFRTTVEGFVIALDSLGSLENLFNIDLVDTVTSAVEESQIGIFEAYQNALSGYREIIASYDGSIQSIELLTNATAVMIQVQLDLVAIYIATGEAISNMFMSSADQVREALLSEEELFNFRKQQIDDLILQASMTTDPEELRRLADEINSLGLANFNMLDESQRAALGPEFIEFFEMLDELFGGQIEEGIDSVIADQAALDEEVSNRMLEAAEALLEAARLQQERDDRRRERQFERRFGGGGDSELRA